jgi:type VI secretion system VasD/TssJ family lipoprotein
MPRAYLLPAVALLAMALTACGGPRSVTLPVRGVSPLNPNEAKESTPVNVRVWPLAGADRFKAATVDQLWTDAKAALGPDLLAAPATFTVFPGGDSDPVVEQRLEVPDSTAFLGVLAMYQRSDAVDQRATVVSIDDAEDLGLVFTGFAVRVSTPDAAPAPAPSAPVPAPAPAAAP